MPILSSTPIVDATATVINTCCCPIPCKHAKLKQESNIPTMLISSDQQRKTNSLVSRNEDECWVDISDRRLRNSRLGALYDGSRFKGVQKCGTSKYNVLVDIQVNTVIIKREGKIGDSHLYFFLLAC